MTDHVHNTVQEHRQDVQVTQEALADAVGVTRQTIIAIEKGNYTPSVALSLRLAVFFKVPVEQLFTLAT